MTPKQLPLLFFLFLSGLAFAESCPTADTDNSLEVLQQSVDSNLIKKLFDPTADQLVKKLADTYQQTDCLYNWMALHEKRFQAERKIDAQTALVWLENSVNNQWRATQNRQEDSLLMTLYVKKGYYENRFSKILEAKQSFESALIISKKNNFQSNWIASYLYKLLGNIHNRLDDRERAIYLLTIGKNMCTPDYKKRSSIVNDLGLAYMSGQQFDKAHSIFEEGLEQPNLSDHHRALFLVNLSESLLRKGALDQATHFAKACLQQTKVLPESQQALYNGSANEILGNACMLQNKPEALDYFLEALSNDLKTFETPHHRQIARTYISIGKYYLREKKHEQAIDYYQNALQCLIPQFKPTSLLENPDQNHLFAENSIFLALEGKASALASIGGTEYLMASLETHKLILEVESLLKENYYYENSKLFLLKESRRRNEKALGIAFELLQQTNNKKYVEEAFQFAEHSKSAILADELHRHKSALQAGVPDQLLSKERTLHRISLEYLQQIKALKASANQSVEDSIHLSRLVNRQLDIDLQKNELNKKITEEFRDINQTLYHRPMVSLKEIQTKVLGKKEAFVEYFIGEQQSFAFVVDHQQINFLDLGEAKVLNELMLQFKNRISQKNNQEDGLVLRDLGSQLYLKLVQSLALSPSVNQLTIIPDGYLNYIPFQAFEIPNFDEQPDYLINHYLINYNYSGDIFYQQLQAEIKPTDNSVLAVAPVNFASSSLANLNETANFINDIASKHTGVFLSKKEASKQRFLEEAANHSQLLLATHAEAGASPKIHFADEPLRLNEIYGLRLKASTAILMACGTADGVLEGGEGVMSLTRALTYAGVPSSTSSLWAVSEQSSSTIITSMMDYLKQGFPKNEALRNAQLDFIKNNSTNPWRWAAFIHIGDPRPAKSTGVWSLFVLGLIGVIGFLKIVV